MDLTTACRLLQVEPREGPPLLDGRDRTDPTEAAIIACFSELDPPQQAALEPAFRALLALPHRSRLHPRFRSAIVAVMADLLGRRGLLLTTDNGQDLASMNREARRLYAIALGTKGLAPEAYANRLLELLTDAPLPPLAIVLAAMIEATRPRLDAVERGARLGHLLAEVLRADEGLWPGVLGALALAARSPQSDRSP